jgi:predicted oxidoreductase
MTVVAKVQIAPQGPMLSRMVQGYWRLADWNLNPQQILSFVESHLELGITTVDHAHVYGHPPCESLFGEALKLDPKLRQQLEIVSKCGIAPAAAGAVAHYQTGRQAILSSVEESLRRLGTDYLDVLLVHRADFLMDADEVADAFGHLRQRGMVRYFGVSNFNCAQMSLLQSRLEQPLVTNQIELNPINLDVLESGMPEFLQEARVRPMAWSCLGGGALFGDTSERMERVRATLNELKDELGAASIEQVVYAWVMRMPTQPLPILGSGNPARIKSAVDSLGLHLSPEQWYRVWSASRGHAVP